MSIIIRTNEFKSGSFNNELYRHSSWLLFAGLALFVLGVIAVGDLLLATAIQYQLFGSLLLIASTIFIIHAVKFWHDKAVGFVLHLLAGGLYGAIGLLFLIPIKSVIIVSIASWLLIAAYTIVGLFRVTIAFKQQVTDLSWNWTCLSGIVNFLLAEALLLLRWIFSSIWLIGFTIAIDILFAGWAIYMLNKKNHP
jgi:uncharacterized membrane protein HdeD (DUF308 family)